MFVFASVAMLIALIISLMIPLTEYGSPLSFFRGLAVMKNANINGTNGHVLVSTQLNDNAENAVVVLSKNGHIEVEKHDIL